MPLLGLGRRAANKSKATKEPEASSSKNTNANGICNENVGEEFEEQPDLELAEKLPWRLYKCWSFLMWTDLEKHKQLNFKKYSKIGLGEIFCSLIDKKDAVVDLDKDNEYLMLEIKEVGGRFETSDGNSKLITKAVEMRNAINLEIDPKKLEWTLTSHKELAEVLFRELKDGDYLFVYGAQLNYKNRAAVLNNESNSGRKAILVLNRHNGIFEPTLDENTQLQAKHVDSFFLIKTTQPLTFSQQVFPIKLRETISETESDNEDNTFCTPPDETSPTKEQNETYETVEGEEEQDEEGAVAAGDRDEQAQEAATDDDEVEEDNHVIQINSPEVNLAGEPDDDGDIILGSPKDAQISQPDFSQDVVIELNTQVFDASSAPKLTSSSSSAQVVNGKNSEPETEESDDDFIPSKLAAKKGRRAITSENNSESEPSENSDEDLEGFIPPRRVGTRQSKRTKPEEFVQEKNYKRNTRQATKSPLAKSLVSQEVILDSDDEVHDANENNDQDIDDVQDTNENNQQHDDDPLEMLDVDEEESLAEQQQKKQEKARRRLFSDEEDSDEVQNNVNKVGPSASQGIPDSQNVAKIVLERLPATVVQGKPVMASSFKRSAIEDVDIDEDDDEVISISSTSTVKGTAAKAAPRKRRKIRRYYK